MQIQTISKSKFKPHVLFYLRKVEKTKEPITITHFGKPVVKIVPVHKGQTENEKKAEQILKKLRGTVIKYENPLEPVGLEDWELLP